MTLFLASDRSIAVEITPAALKSIVEECSGDAQLETGGVLLGRYGEYGDRVVIWVATGPPSDSRRFPARFIRGIAGLTQRLAGAWTDGLYYVGEWHLHPRSSPRPSGQDAAQTVRFAQEVGYRCPHPVLVVIGGWAPDWSFSVGVAVAGVFRSLDAVTGVHIPQ